MSVALQHFSLERQAFLSCLRPCYRRYLASSAHFHLETVPILLPNRLNSRLFSSSLLISAKSKQKEPPVLTPSLLEQSKLLDYLAHVASMGNGVTLADLETLRPKSHSQPGTQEYEKEYNNLLDIVVRSFSKDQLREFLRNYELVLPSKKTKWNIAATIIEQQWKWPSLTMIQKQHRDWTEISIQDYPLTAEQSFLLLGQDGVDLLSLSSKFNVHLSLSRNPLSLRVEGLRGSLERLSKYLGDFKETIGEEIFQSVNEQEIPSYLIKRISRLSNAFVVSLGNGRYRISFRRANANATTSAKRLLTRAACMASENPSSYLVYIPRGVPLSKSSLSAFVHSYSLYPYQTSQLLPWTLSGGGLFRVRRVGEWLEVNSIEDTFQTGGLESEDGSLLSLNREDGEFKSLLQQWMPSPSDSYAKRLVTASPGHFLISSPEQRTSLKPPLNGALQISDIVDWMRHQRPKHIFNSCIPRALLNLPSETQQILHRVIYAALPDKQNPGKAVRLLYFEVLLGTTANENGQVEGSFSEADSNLETPNSFIQKNLPLADQKLSLRPSLKTGQEATLHVIMPDRSMDIRISAFDYSVEPSLRWPKELQRYFNQLHSFLTSPEQPTKQPETPLFFSHDGVSFALKSAFTVQQNQKTVTPPQARFNPSDDFQVVTESLQDSESHELLSNCQVRCSDISSETSWKDFLRRCDWLTTHT